MVKGRNEPATISHVAHIVAKLKGVPVEELCETYVHSTRLLDYCLLIIGL